jgi:DNA-damage-inducible protein J
MTMVHVRLDDGMKEQASHTLQKMGLTLSEAVRMFLSRVVADQAIPFSVKVPNATTIAAMEQARRMGPAKLEGMEGLERELSAETLRG